MAQQGFTLIEIAVVLVLAGLLALGATQLSSSSTRSGCYATSSEQLTTIKKALHDYVIKNDRYPLPAQTNLGINDPKYGREADAAQISGGLLDNYGSGAANVTYGALPFQALGLPTSYAADCWDNKFTYAVTTAFTSTTPTVGGFLDASVNGALIIKNTIANTILTNAAYAVISHGADGLGATPRNYDGATKKWCSRALGATDLRTENCNVTDNVIMAAEFNDGHDGADNYFDDIVTYLGKLQAISAPTGTSNVYGWGFNGTGQIGDATTTNRPVPTMTSGGITFDPQSIRGNIHSCALDLTGKAYCWGFNPNGELGDGTTTDKTAPTAVSTGLTFTQIAVGQRHSCAITGGGQAYCWGLNTHGEVGNGTVVSPVLTPALVTPAPLFTRITVGDGFTCGLTSSGAAWCWGDNADGETGNNTMTAYYATPTAVTMGGHIFTSITAGGTHACAIANDDAKTYCWGNNDFGAIGDGTSGTARRLPTAVVTAHYFARISAGGWHSCGLENTGTVYCWGQNLNGQLGNGSTTASTTPVAATVGSFVEVSAGGEVSCALQADGTAYCWGGNTYGDVGDTTTVQRTVPTMVSTAHKFATISSGIQYTIAALGLPQGIPADGKCNATNAATTVPDYSCVSGYPANGWNYYCDPCTLNGHNFRQWVCKGVNGGADRNCASPMFVSCFLPDVRMTMADGSTKRMADLVIGDEVRGHTRTNRVVTLPTFDSDQRIYGVNGGVKFVTGGHPFFTAKGWKAIDPSLTATEGHHVRTTKLLIGDRLLLDTGKLLVIRSIESESSGTHQLFNPAVDGDHTYFANGMLVHNKCIGTCYMDDAALSCPSKIMSWGGYCYATAPLTTDGNISPLTSAAPSTTGSAGANCNNGMFTLLTPSCSP